MSEKEKGKLALKEVLVEVGVACVIFLVFAILITVLINGGELDSEYSGLMITTTVFISGAVSSMLMKRSVYITGLVSTCILILVILVLTFVHREVVSINTALKNIAFLSFGRIILLVINKPKKRKVRRK